jgi:hypothetical protein
MRKLIFRVMRSVCLFTLVLFVIPGALDSPLRTVAYGLGWGGVVAASCYAFIVIVEWLARVSQRRPDNKEG